jgi:hypothetical protein
MAPSTVYVLTPLSPQAKAWVEENVHYEPYQTWGQGIVIEWRYIEDIVEGLKQSGFEPERDFTVRA